MSFWWELCKETPAMQPVRVLASLSYLHRAWKQHSGSALLGMGQVTQTKQLFGGAVNCTVNAEAAAAQCLPCLSWHSLLRAASLCHAGCGLHSSTQCSFFQVTDLQIRPEDRVAPFVLCAGASLLLAHCPQCALSLPAPAALSLCCSCWPQKVSHHLGPRLKLD